MCHFNLRINQKLDRDTQSLEMSMSNQVCLAERDEKCSLKAVWALLDRSSSASHAWFSVSFRSDPQSIWSYLEQWFPTFLRMQPFITESLMLW